MALKKNVLLAGALTMIALFGAMEINRRFFSQKDKAPESTEIPETPAAAIFQEREWAHPFPGEIPAARNIILENDVFQLTFNSAGGILARAVLKEYSDSDGSPVEMIYQDQESFAPFLLHFGSPEISPNRDVYNSSVSPVGNRVEFFLDFTDERNNLFTVKKTYSIEKDSYLIRLTISIESKEGVIPYIEGQNLYTLSFGPQIGPLDKRVDGRNDFRYFTFLIDGEEKNIRAQEAEITEVRHKSLWIGIEGKYFAFITVPENPGQTMYHVSEYPDPSIGKQSVFYISRQDPQAYRVEDSYTLYLGPKDKTVLARSSEHPWLSGTGAGLDKLIGENRALGWLNRGLSGILKFFYSLIPNFGLGIILLALIVKAVLYPLSNPAYLFHAKLKPLRPEIEAINKRHLGNKTAANEALSELFTKNNIKPRSSLLPLVIQLPLFMSLYTVLSMDITFRQALFIPGWIPDISLPDALWDFSPFTLPVIGWQAIRALPFLFLGVILIQSRFTQSPLPGSRSMKLMSVFMPVFIFLILYELPSGVTLFLLILNALNLAHQLIVLRKFSAPS